jgi:hypothetical protein
LKQVLLQSYKSISHINHPAVAALTPPSTHPKAPHTSTTHNLFWSSSDCTRDASTYPLQTGLAEPLHAVTPAIWCNIQQRYVSTTSTKHYINDRMNGRTVNIDVPLSSTQFGGTKKSVTTCLLEYTVSAHTLTAMAVGQCAPHVTTLDSSTHWYTRNTNTQYPGPKLLQQ